MKNIKPNFNKIDRLINEKLKFIYRDEKLKFNVKHYSNIILDLIKKVNVILNNFNLELN